MVTSQYQAVSMYILYIFICITQYVHNLNCMYCCMCVCFFRFLRVVRRVYGFVKRKKMFERRVVHYKKFADRHRHSYARDDARL